METTFKKFWEKLIANYEAMIQLCNEEIEKGNDPMWWSEKKKYCELKIDIAKRQMDMDELIISAHLKKVA